MPLYQLETHPGEPYTIGGLRITPFARSLTIRLPGFPGGLIWNRPTSVLVQGEDGSEVVLPVHDLTRRRQFTWLGLGLFVGAIVWLLFKR